MLRCAPYYPLDAHWTGNNQHLAQPLEAVFSNTEKWPVTSTHCDSCKPPLQKLTLHHPTNTLHYIAAFLDRAHKGQPGKYKGGVRSLSPPITTVLPRVELGRSEEHTSELQSRP